MIRRHGGGGSGIDENRGGYHVIDNNAII